MFFTYAESGFGEYLIGRHNAIGCTGSAELEHTFGKVTASLARNKGSVGLSVANVADLALPFNNDSKEVMDRLCESCDEGLITDERLDEAVSRVLAETEMDISDNGRHNLRVSHRRPYQQIFLRVALV